MEKKQIMEYQIVDLVKSTPTVVFTTLSKDIFDMIKKSFDSTRYETKIVTKTKK